MSQCRVTERFPEIACLLCDNGLMKSRSFSYDIVKRALKDVPCLYHINYLYQEFLHSLDEVFINGAGSALPSSGPDELVSD